MTLTRPGLNMATKMAKTSAFWILLLMSLISSTLAQYCTKTGPCSCTMDDGTGTIDLSPLGAQGGIAYEDYYAVLYPDTFTYSWNPCFSFSKSGCSGVAVCQVGQSDPSEAYDLGVHDNADFQPDFTGGGIALYYNSLSYERTTKISLICSTSGTTTFTVDGEDPSYFNNYDFRLESPYCCPQSGPGPTGPGPGPGPIVVTVDISVGSILCIVFFPTAFIYIVGGVLLNKYARQKEGRDIIPNMEFWASLPGLIKDGFLFAISPIRKQSSYEQV